MTTQLTEERTEIYSWLNELTEKTGLSTATITELYLNGWIHVEELDTTEVEKGTVPATKHSFWKKTATHPSLL